MTRRDGLLLVRKPVGITSFDVVARVRRGIGTRSVGHTGTLDPFADGLLVVMCGSYTRLGPFLVVDDKRYRARFRLGVTTNTDDLEGEILAESDASLVTREHVDDVVANFRGEVSQIPPAFSAIHVDGERAYARARRGETVEMPARIVTFFAIDIVEFVPGQQAFLDVDIHCSKGTYIRALARDIGSRLSVGGACATLTRTHVGPFHVDGAIEIPDLRAGENLEEWRLRLSSRLVFGRAALPFLPDRELTLRECALIRQGRDIDVVDEAGPPGPLVAHMHGEIVALCERQKSGLHPIRVFPPPE